MNGLSTFETNRTPSAIVFTENNNGELLFEESQFIEIIPLNKLQIEILKGGAEIIEKIFAEWTELCEEGVSDDPFLRPEWFSVFVKNFESEIELFTIRRNGKLRAVLPVVEKRATLHGVPVRKLQSVFNLQTQRFDLIHGADENERQEIIETLWNALKRGKNRQVLEFRLVKKDSWLADLLALAEKENYKTGIWQMDSAPFITLPQGNDKEKLIEEFSKTLKRHFRQELKRRLKRLKELGTVEFVVTRKYAPELMRKYFDLEAKSWKGRGGTAAACDLRSEKLHEDFARAVADKDALFIYELKLDGETIAMSINIKYDRRTIFWKTSFSEKYSRYSPGNLVIWEFLKDCIRRGSTELDMLSPATDYKKVWATGEREHAAFYVFRRGIIGTMLWNWKFSVISRLRKFKNKKL